MTDPVLDWARSGAMALSGAPDGPPLVPVGAPTAVLREALDVLPPDARPDLTLLGTRSAAAGFTRNAPWSAGGAFRMVQARDGWLAVSMARSTDFDLLSALVEAEVDDPWATIGRWARDRPTAQATARAELLGMPVAAVAEIGTERPPVLITATGAQRRVRDRPIVVDLTSLWAGPLCAYLLGRCGARVIKVEGARRPDGARNGPPEFYDLLHAGHESVAVDFTEDRAALRRLLASADVVLEASRPRALQQVGIDADEIAAGGTVWVSITAYGREHPMRVGFGDDIAAAGGLVCHLDGVPVPAGDALADPLAGASAAAAAWQALSEGRGCILDVSMAAVAAYAAARSSPAAIVSQQDDGWIVETLSGSEAVHDPMAAKPEGVARPLGTDTAAVFAEFS